MRLIDADALLEQLSKKDSEVHIGLVMQLIDSMPTFQREERDKLVDKTASGATTLRPIDIEKIAKENGFIPYVADDGECYADIKTLKQFAEAYAAKVLEDKECEIAELKEKFKSYKEESLNEIVSLNKICSAYQSNINDLRETLEKTATKVITDGNPSTTYLYEDIHEALSKTPAQSLIEHDNEVIERCAKVCINKSDWFANDVVDEICALKEVK